MPYRGHVLLDNQPRKWIDFHRSFASEDWFKSQICWGLWIWHNRGDFVVETKVIEGTKDLTIVIHVSYHPNGTEKHPFKHVLVRHAHVLRKKRRQ